MTITQIASTPNSVTIEIGGMENEYDRKTLIYLMSDISYTSGYWTDLDTAKAQGYVADYIVSDYEKNNGTIEIVINSKWSNCKVWHFAVQRCIKGTDPVEVESELIIPTLLGFTYDETTTKSTGEPIDITINDMQQIGYFGYHTGLMIAKDKEAYTFDFSGYVSGVSEIEADYLRVPAKYIADAANYIGYWGVPVQDRLLNILSYVKKGADFKASYFNEMQQAINNFMPSVSD